MAPPRQTDPQHKLRLTPELRDKLQRAADKNFRSFNAEILNRLERTFAVEERMEGRRQEGSQGELEEIIDQINDLSQVVKDIQDKAFDAMFEGDFIVEKLQRLMPDDEDDDEKDEDSDD